MADDLEVIGNGHSPKDVIFKYSSKGGVPVTASYENGDTFTGQASGTRGIADWYGPYNQGVPDGEFKVVLGDRQSFKYLYVKGQYIEKA